MPRLSLKKSLQTSMPSIAYQRYLFCHNIYDAYYISWSLNVTWCVITVKYMNLNSYITFVHRLTLLSTATYLIYLYLRDITLYKTHTHIFV